MKRIKIASTLLTALIIAACSSSKKATTSAGSTAPATTSAATTTTPAATATPVVTKPSTTVKSRNGIFVPGIEELTAIQLKYKDVTMQTLTDGHAIYVGTCTSCHNAKSIYSRPEEVWRGIIDDMAPKSKITAAEKDAVYKYVMAIKATQSKESKAAQESKSDDSNYFYNPDRSGK